MTLGGWRAWGGLRARLVVAFVLVALVSAVTATGLAYRESRTAVLDRKQDAVRSDFRGRVEQVAADLSMPPDEVSLTRFAVSVAEGLGDAVVVAEYRSLTASSDASADRTRISRSLRDAVRDRNRMSLQRVERHGSPYLVVGTPVTFASGPPSGLDVFAITSLRAEEDDTAAILDSVRDGLLPVVLLAAVLALLAARTVLRPVRELGRATRRHAAGDLTSRVAAPSGRDELADLARDFNRTAEALEKSVAELREQEARARRFVADVSHELRTPLAAMTMVATVLDEDAGQLPPDAARAARTVSAETARLARLVDDLMEMSRFDSGAARLNLGEVDLAETLRGTLALRGWTSRVHAQLPSGLRAVVDARRVDVAVANLVGNALRHGAPPVSLKVVAAGERVTVEVADRGPGLPPEVLPHVFDRFYKADSARARSEGSGLGTAIALENARLHGGSIDVANRAGGGAVFTLRMPWRRGCGEGDA
ncbi:sensor histidine kinase [Streptomyces alboniger]|uniref:histidine kinase n=1 Tax=Streptomyces alboniger TaxID=132473 RepID=A0A5J6HM67_STRAD|nr:HAMP domain-containing sensor histidine kinase [Streptomyces alboniger]QEV19390.1 sensor histidine kinase [Streptomyces alboniger]